MKNHERQQKEIRVKSRGGNSNSVNRQKILLNQNNQYSVQI